MDNGKFRARGRGVTLEKVVKDTCLCKRPNSTVHCNVCGYVTVGRIRKHCPQHPMTLFLMDLAQCPRCSSYTFMMQEFTIEQN